MLMPLVSPKNMKNHREQRSSSSGRHNGSSSTGAEWSPTHKSACRECSSSSIKGLLCVAVVSSRNSSGSLVPVRPRSSSSSSSATGASQARGRPVVAAANTTETSTYASYNTSCVQGGAALALLPVCMSGSSHAPGGLCKALGVLTSGAGSILCRSACVRSCRRACSTLVCCWTSQCDSWLSSRTWSSCCGRWGGSSSRSSVSLSLSRSVIGCGVGCGEVGFSCGTSWRAAWLRRYSSRSTSNNNSWSSSGNSISTSRSIRLELLRQQWPLIRQEMVNFFRSQVHTQNDSSSSGAGEAAAHAAVGEAAAGDTEEANTGSDNQASSSSSCSRSRAPFGQSLSVRSSRSSSGRLRSSGSSSSRSGSPLAASTDSSRGIYSIKARTGKVNLLCRPWERFVRKEEIQRANYVPCIVEKFGVERRLAIHRETLEALAFEEEHGHLSHFFQARLFRLHIGGWIEECIPTYVQADPVARRLYFVKFDRHIPGTISEVDVPTTLVGLLACPAYQKGYHIELVMPTIRCQCVGADLPPPIFVDISRLRFKPPYNAITVADLQGVLPSDGTARFHPAYGDLRRQEVVWAYDVGTLPEAPLPDEFVDPNFINRKGQKMDVMFHRQFPN